MSQNFRDLIETEDAQQAHRQPDQSQEHSLKPSLSSKLARAYSSLPSDQRTVIRPVGDSAPVSNPELDIYFGRILVTFPQDGIGKRRDDESIGLLERIIALQVHQEEILEGTAVLNDETAETSVEGSGGRGHSTGAFVAESDKLITPAKVEREFPSLAAASADAKKLAVKPAVRAPYFRRVLVLATIPLLLILVQQIQDEAARQRPTTSLRANQPVGFELRSDREETLAETRINSGSQMGESEFLTPPHMDEDKRAEIAINREVVRKPNHGGRHRKSRSEAERMRAYRPSKPASVAAQVPGV